MTDGKVDSGSGGGTRHSGIFGHCYVYYRNDNDDDEELCISCAKKDG